MRSFNRFSTDEEVDVTVEGERDVATLYNLSCGGCMLEMRNRGAVEGAEVSVNLNDIATAQGHIVWRIDNKAGIKFATPLHQKIVEMLGYSAVAEKFDAGDPRDRFGLPLHG
ncbi:PilZ domain-containing protein [Erythrobacter litoralis]|uniref:PilZ domain-containing protein n=1 Tax=Erythrobacter litoralis (strain HTCC2594) TaxID=314225 RepID=Q2NBQ9_ERYLH|nr:PilZ domain-containing protein [Erythrobacter litoralis]ABC62882.1 hypothetical protein ELI_03950 [Erythrobacter litoralis HTCC2594]